MSDGAQSSDDITCYDRFGDVSENRRTCSLDGSLTQCCSKNQFCASNGLCISDPENEDQFLPYAVEGCTDRGWGDRGCVDACLNLGVGVDVCPELGDDVFCCWGTTGCNCTSLNSPGVFRRENSVPVAPLDASGLLPASATPPATTSTAIESTNASSVDSTTSSPQTVSADQTASSGAARSTNTDETSTDSDGGSENTLAIGVGLGVGIPLLIVILVLAWCLRRRRHNTPKDTNTTAVAELSSNDQHPHQGGYLYSGQQKLEPMTPSELPPGPMNGYTEQHIYQQHHGNEYPTERFEMPAR